MVQLNKLFESFDNRGEVHLNSHMEVIFVIGYKELTFNFAKISYDESLAYDIPEQAPKKYTMYEKQTHTAFFRYVDDEQELKCKVLEWLSRPAVKEGDKTTQQWYLDGINKYLGTNFTHEDIDEVYCHLGNNVNRNLTLEFIRNDYDINVLKKEK